MISLLCLIIALILLVSGYIQYKTKNIFLVSGYNKNNTESFSDELKNKICNTTAWVLCLNGISLCVSAIFMLVDEKSIDGLFLCMIAYILITVLISLTFNNNHKNKDDLSESYYLSAYKRNIVLYIFCIVIMVIITNRYENSIDISISGFGNIDNINLSKYILISILSFTVSIDSLLINYILTFKTRTNSTLREISINLLNICIVIIIYISIS